VIKTYFGKPEEVDKLVNDFMTTKGQDLPVRTEVYNGLLYATIFFNEFNRGQVVSEERVKDKKEKALLGTLWEQPGKKLSGYFKDNKTLILPEERENFEIVSEEPFIAKGKVKGESVKLVKNNKKKSDKSPDFYIFEPDD